MSNFFKASRRAFLQGGLIDLAPGASKKAAIAALFFFRRRRGRAGRGDK